MTKEDLIDITCLWLDQNQSNFTQRSSGYGRIYVSGACQTELRAFLNKVKEGTKEQALKELGRIIIPDWFKLELENTEFDYGHNVKHSNQYDNEDNFN